MVFNKSLMAAVSRKDRGRWIKVMKLLTVVSDFAQMQTKGSLPTYRCHSICRAIARHVRGLRVMDGEYIGVEQIREKGEIHVKPTTVRHSWLVTLSGCIIDPYPAGILAFNPIIVVNRGVYAPFGSGLYIQRSRDFTKEIMTAALRREIKDFTRFIGTALAHVSAKK